MYNPETVLVMICELRELVDNTTEKLHLAKLEIQQLRQGNMESDGNIRSLMQENGTLQGTIFNQKLEIERLREKYESQRQ